MGHHNSDCKLYSQIVRNACSQVGQLSADASLHFFLLLGFNLICVAMALLLKSSF